VLNPLGVPSRMNIGQIYETVLGWLMTKVENMLPIFDGASLDQINELTDEVWNFWTYFTFMMVVLESFTSSSNCWCNLYVEIRIWLMQILHY
jgi:VanZ family protein